MNHKAIANIEGLKFSDHAKKQALAKGFTPEQIFEALTNPRAVVDVRQYVGQKRWCGGGVALVINTKNHTVVTMYADMVRTPLRPDQMNDPKALASKRALR